MDQHSKGMHILIYVFLVVTLVGLADSVYLAVAYFTGTPLSCEIISGCNEVANSPYSHIAGVSLPAIGVIYYIFAVINALYYLIARSSAGATMLAFSTTVGFLASLYFEYLQVFVIKAICIYCLISAIAATILFFIGVFVRKHHIRYHDVTE